MKKLKKTQVKFVLDLVANIKGGYGFNIFDLHKAGFTAKDLNRINEINE